MSMTPEDMRALAEARGGTVNAPATRPTTPEQQPFYDDPYLAYGRAKYGTVEGTLGGTAINPTTTTATTTTTTTADATTTASTGFEARADAKNTIRAVLATYGLGDLSDYLYGVYARGEVDIQNPDALIFLCVNKTHIRNGLLRTLLEPKRFSRTRPVILFATRKQLPSTPAIERFTARFLRSDRRFYCAT
mgnify:CR=1 FL=1